ncbi:peptidyl-prolyl cis-trans isomerase [Porifericola rhodea]|uniref:peptidylprolyl isomerase n=1 Tax=Porifericola rhodea TaxID=930972 RepID=UPI002666528C|nr:peptidylprolyl isomerase [Porifericola rhodea]WKN31020.1 peptidyl-prolyl cis-trans isomerase [Porifericola rhodea]
MKRVIFFCIISLGVWACTVKKKAAESDTLVPLDLSQKAIFHYGEDSVIADDFLYIYQKNNQDVAANELNQSVRNYLELYINFKLKVKEAYLANFDKTSKFQAEYQKYRQQLAKPYMVENRFNEKMVLEAYERLKEEVHASHILINVPDHIKGSDTLQYYQKADSIRNLALKGQSFAMLAEKYSDDPSAEQNGGNLGYFSALQMVYPFESAAFKTPVGDISKPVRTSFGYHIIKVDDRRPTQGKVKVAHIMIRHQPGEVEDKSSESYKKALQIYDELQKEADWKELTERFSEDLSTRSNEGELPYFSTGGMLPNFEEAAFSLNQIGEISKPIKTRYGWHIIKLLDKKGLEPLEMLRPLIERKVERNLQQLEMQDEMVEMLKEENNYVPNLPSIQLAQSYMVATPEMSRPNRMGVLFSISDTIFTYSSLSDYLEEENIQLPVDSMRAKELYSQFEAQRILAYEESHLAEKYPEFRRLAQEYKEGILLFDIMESKIWSTAGEDENALMSFYKNHQDNYQWDKRIEATILDARSEEILDKATEMLGQEEATPSTIKRIEKSLNTDSPLNLQMHHDIYEKGEDRSKSEAVIDEIEWKVGTTMMANEGRFYLIQVHEVLPAQSKEFEEVRGLVISDYQDMLDSEWISELRNKYTISIDQAVLEQVIKQLKDKNE